jgi:putative chitinase
MKITIEQLKKAMPTCRRPETWLDLLNTYLPTHEISSVKQVSRFLAQTGHESNSYNALEENLNYSKDGLLKTFPKYFGSSENMDSFDRNPAAIANRVYSNRMGNGNESSGDGYKFHGRGLIQVTGRANYTACSKFIFNNDNLITDPGLLLIPEYALKSAIWFWTANKLNAVEDNVKLTKLINGGTHGLEDRQSRYDLALSVLQ